MGQPTSSTNRSEEILPGPQGKFILRVSLNQSQVSNSFVISVPVYLYVKNQPHLIGFIRMTGDHAVQANVTLGFRRDKAAIDVDHHMLAIENQ
jgi:hypothetical protein